MIAPEFTLEAGCCQMGVGLLSSYGENFSLPVLSLFRMGLKVVENQLFATIQAHARATCAGLPQKQL